MTDKKQDAAIKQRAAEMEREMRSEFYPDQREEVVAAIERALREGMAMYEQDAKRLEWAMNHMAVREIHNQFIAHVLRVGGNGDLDDCRVFVDAAMLKEEGK